MKRSLVLLKFTDYGAKEIAHSTKRGAAFAENAAKHNVAIEAQYWTTGSLDGALVLAAPDQSKILRCVAELNATGAVRAETISAFTATEWDAILNE